LGNAGAPSLREEGESKRGRRANPRGRGEKGLDGSAKVGGGRTSRRSKLTKEGGKKSSSSYGVGGERSLEGRLAEEPDPGRGEGPGEEGGTRKKRQIVSFLVSPSTK